MINLWKQGRNSVCQMLDACWSSQGKINGTEFEVLFDTPSQGLKNAECKWVVWWMLERPGKLVQWMIEVVLAEDVGCIFSVCPCSILVGRKTWLEPRNEDNVHHSWAAQKHQSDNSINETGKNTALIALSMVFPVSASAPHDKRLSRETRSWIFSARRGLKFGKSINDLLALVIKYIECTNENIMCWNCTNTFNAEYVMLFHTAQLHCFTEAKLMPDAVST